MGSAAQRPSNRTRRLIGNRRSTRGRDLFDDPFSGNRVRSPVGIAAETIHHHLGPLLAKNSACSRPILRPAPVTTCGSRLSVRLAYELDQLTDLIVDIQMSLGALTRAEVPAPRGRPSPHYGRNRHRERNAEGTKTRTRPLARVSRGR